MLSHKTEVASEVVACPTHSRTDVNDMVEPAGLMNFPSLRAMFAEAYGSLEFRDCDVNPDAKKKTKLLTASMLAFLLELEIVGA